MGEPGFWYCASATPAEKAAARQRIPATVRPRLAKQNELTRIVDPRSVQLHEVHAVRLKAAAAITAIPLERAESAPGGRPARDLPHEAPAQVEDAELNRFSRIDREDAIGNVQELAPSRPVGIGIRSPQRGVGRDVDRAFGRLEGGAVREEGLEAVTAGPASLEAAVDYVVGWTPKIRGRVSVPGCRCL